MITVAAFTGGHNIPSARFRVRQYIPALKKLGIQIKEYYAILGCYPPNKSILRPIWGIGTLIQRVPSIIKSYNADITLLQREMLSTFTTIEILTKRPRILDVDDAIWLNREGYAKKLSRLCDVIICGNSFIAETFQLWNSNIYILPTTVDCDRFRPRKTNINHNPVIVWSGTSSGFPYLYGIENALVRVLEQYPNTKLRIVSDKSPNFKNLSLKRIEFLQWNPEVEVSSLQSANIGIMPLEDSLWARGKCSYKMLTYMACGLPVVGSPVGMNKEILSLEKVGHSASGQDEWIDSLVHLLDDKNCSEQLGRNGRAFVESQYSLNAIAPKFAEIIKTYA